MSGEPDQLLLSFAMSFASSPPQGVVTPLCQSLADACQPFMAGDAAARLRLAAHELFENIVKYSQSGECELGFQLFRKDSGAMRARVETRNVPAASHRADAEQRLAALCTAPDPLAHYDAIIADSARRPAGSGLGLARIHAETEYRLGYRFENEALVIVASGDVWLRGALP
ncbi:MAG TPA: hypothetical protein VIW29_03400 [Polyangiaceae bacterium]